MTRSVNRIAATVLVALLVGALVFPAAAFGTGSYSGDATASGNGIATSTGPSYGTTGEQAGEAAVTQLQARIGFALQNRARRFDAATAALERTRARLEQVTDAVEDLGGDVSQVRTRLRDCEQLLVQAQEQERAAARLFQGIPQTEDKTGAFLRARTQARNAVATMNQARIQLRLAADDLEEAIVDLAE
jgi:DNA repair ATPase RecN